MLTQAHVQRYSTESGLRDIMIAEKEVVLTFLLQLLSERGILDRMAFRGGTCLRKMFIGSNGRFSEFEQDQRQKRRDRETILDERENLRHLFPVDYSPDISVCKDGKVEVMFKLTVSQAQGLPRLLKEHDL